MDAIDLKKQLSLAAGTLLGLVDHSAAAADTPRTWTLETAVLYYQEAGDRISAIEPVINFSKGFSGDKKLNLKFTLDVLTGATPTGAAPSNVPQTFTRPSGAGSYVIQPGETPLDDTFHDTRVAGNVSFTQPLGRLTTLSYGLNYSSEFDFRSMGINATLARDFNERNTTLSLGLAHEADVVEPKGNIPVPFATMNPAGAPISRLAAEDDKSVNDLVLGWTQLLSPRTILQTNYSYSRASGYLNDPYKILSVVDRNTGATTAYVYENRPDLRVKHALYWLIRHRLKRDVVSLDYRYFFDDWGVKSHTLGLSYRIQPSEKMWFEPLLRFYSQSEADFYRVQLLSGDPLPAEASADYRLAGYQAYTFGLKQGWRFANASEFILSLQYYMTRGEDHPSEAIGVQRGLDFYPETKATMVQLQYKF